MEADKGKINNKNTKISKQHHITEEIDESGQVQYNCTACQKTFRSRSQKYYHINCNQLQNLVYKCDYCDRSFARLTQWKYHTESHISPVNECQKCQKSFSNPLALKKHVALHKVEPKLCPHCDKTFKKKISLDQHIAAQHLKQLQYGCAYCSKKYGSKSTLQLHLQTHEKKRFECNFCGKLFQRNSILSLHLKRHLKTNSYNCTVCHKVFSESGALARHRKIHEESVTQYYCKLCEKCILRKDNMTRHLNTIHPEESFDNIVKIITSPITPTKLQTTLLESETHDFNYPKQESQEICLISEKPLTNHIKVITAVPTYQKEIITNNTENTSQEIIQQYTKTNHQQEDSIIYENQKASCENSARLIGKYDLIKMENDVVEQSDKNIENISLVNNVPAQTGQEDKAHQLSLYQDSSYARKSELNTFVTANEIQQQPVQNREPPITVTFSSVIRSVGNVKKNLTSHMSTTTKSVNQTSLDYKHKKYCRNNYNIDLYRKILGCDEDDDDVDVEKQQKVDNILKSPTPVHWRKCFKNNYETSAL